MALRRVLVDGAAIGSLIAVSLVSTSLAETPKHRAVHRTMAHAPRAASKMDAILAQVQDLKASLAAETAARVALEAEVARANAAAQAAQSQVQVAQAQVQAAQSRDDAAVETIPTAVAQAVEKAKPKTDGLYFKGVKITPGGFLETAVVYREHNTANDISTGLNTIPFPQSRQGHEDEFLFTPRQSRVSVLVEGKPNSDVTLSMYGEFDFQGAAQSANSNESNSYNPRIRHLYGTIDWAESGWHFLAGQTFSLVTLNSDGISPRKEVTPLTIDGQYTTGFTWTRQPGVRLTKDLFDKTLWLAVSAENPQTTFSGTVPTGVVNTINNGQGYYAGETNTGAAATQSLNHIPDFIAKGAVEEDVEGHHLHAEAYGLARSFYEQLPDFKTNNVTTAGVGFGLSAQIVPGLLDVQASGLSGRGVGRYASGQLPDATFNANGHIVPIKETIALVGGILHPTKSLDLYIFGGEEHDDRVASGTIGYGNPLFVNSGCETEASTLTCTGNTRLLEEISTGFWRKLYTGPWGQARFGLQYSYVERNAFSGVGGAPEAHENLLYTSFRYYPFQ
jgi:hypothetical protein